MIAKEPKYISLKEAAHISGYSADYVGQLIRSGKLPGKQVFSNVAWMTTEEALQAYLNKDAKVEVKPKFFEKMYDTLFSLQGLSQVYTYALWCAIAVLAIFVLFLAYILAVSIDHAIEARYLENVRYER